MQTIKQKIRITSLAAVVGVMSMFAIPHAAQANTHKIVTDVMQGLTFGQTPDEVKAQIHKRGGNPDLIECADGYYDKATRCKIEKAIGLKTYLGQPIQSLNLDFNADNKLYKATIWYDLERITGDQDRVSYNLLRKLNQMVKPAKIESAPFGIYRAKLGEHELSYSSRHTNDMHFPAAVHNRITLSVAHTAMYTEIRKAKELADKKPEPSPGWFTRFMKWARS